MPFKSSRDAKDSLGPIRKFSVRGNAIEFVAEWSHIGRILTVNRDDKWMYCVDGTYFVSQLTTFVVISPNSMR